MTMQNTAAAPMPKLGVLARLLADYQEWRRRRAAYRAAIDELERLDDRDLADLRLDRADFHHRASRAAEAG